jgi:hypothetical protein
MKKNIYRSYHRQPGWILSTAHPYFSTLFYSEVPFVFFHFGVFDGVSVGVVKFYFRFIIEGNENILLIRSLISFFHFIIFSLTILSELGVFFSVFLFFFNHDSECLSNCISSHHINFCICFLKK